MGTPGNERVIVNSHFDVFNNTHILHGTTKPRHIEVDLIAHRQTDRESPLQSVQFNYIP